MSIMCGKLLAIALLGVDIILTLKWSMNKYVISVAWRAIIDFYIDTFVQDLDNTLYQLEFAQQTKIPEFYNLEINIISPFQES